MVTPWTYLGNGVTLADVRAELHHRMNHDMSKSVQPLPDKDGCERSAFQVQQTLCEGSGGGLHAAFI